MKLSEQEITEIFQTIKWSTKSIKSLGGQSCGVSPVIIVAELPELELKIELSTRSQHKSRMIIISMIREFLNKY